MPLQTLMVLKHVAPHQDRPPSHFQHPSSNIQLTYQLDLPFARGTTGGNGRQVSCIISWEKKIRNRNMMSPVFEPRFTHMLVHRVTTSEGHLNSWTPQNLHRAPSGYHAALESVHLISTYSINTLVTDTQGQLPIPASDGWGWWSRGRGC